MNNMKFNDAHFKGDYIELEYYKTMNILDIVSIEGSKDECVVQFDKETLGNFIESLQDIYNQMEDGGYTGEQ